MKKSLIRTEKTPVTKTSIACPQAVYQTRRCVKEIEGNRPVVGFENFFFSMRKEKKGKKQQSNWSSWFAEPLECVASTVLRIPQS